jgi:hypothetical protein
LQNPTCRRPAANVVVPAYQEIIWEIVYAIITMRLKDFVEFAKSVSKAANLSGS